MSSALRNAFLHAAPALLSIVLAACGGARATTSASTTTAHEETESPSTPPPPCTAWDPDADPLVAPADVAAAPEHARRSISGLRWCVLREGDGNAHPHATDHVTVHYTGWTTDGEMFDSSRARGAPATFPLDGVIAGWTEGVQLMTVGEIRRFWIPQSLAYGGRMGSPQGTLVFDVELISIAP
jgi:hypothetical protein